MNDWISPRLGVKFEVKDNIFSIYRPDGKRFLTSVELNQEKELALTQLAAEKQRYQDLLTLLRERGINPEELR